MLLLAASVHAQGLDAPGSVHDARYATDAYPGFDSEKNFAPERKSPKWFAFINGPDCGNAATQMSHCRELEAEGKWSKAAKQYDALVREWPTSSEAPEAQRSLAQILEEREGDLEDAFAEYRYLLDFFSQSCDYGAVADRMYEVARRMREEGKTIMFFRFKNTVDVRHAFEAAVLRAPGAKWAPAAMLEIADLREEEGRDEEAVKVYENLRNIHPGSDEAKSAWLREAEARMVLLREHEYNRSRCRDTIDFLKQAVTGCRQSDVARLQEFLSEAQGLIAEEEWRAVKFYDSPTRTRRSAVSAYEKYIAENPGGAHAEEAKARLSELKEVRK